MGMILLIEDDGALVRDLSNELKDLGHDVKNAYSYVSAIEYWKKHEGHFDCIILDLHINPDGLDISRMNQYYPLIGMAFLDEICKDKSLEEKKYIWKKTVIYSGYISALMDSAHEFEWNLKLLKLIPKRPLSISHLLTHIKQMI